MIYRSSMLTNDPRTTGLSNLHRISIDRRHRLRHRHKSNLGRQNPTHGPPPTPTTRLPPTNPPRPNPAPSPLTTAPHTTAPSGSSAKKVSGHSTRVSCQV